LKVDRRTFLVGGGVGIGLIVGFALWPRRIESDLAVRQGEEAFGTFIKIAKSGQITVAVPQVETGQGVWTALPQIVADELGAAWETIAVEPAPLANAYANPLAEEEGWPARSRITAGSTSIRAFEQPLREAAAVARMVLVGAAADRWNVNPAECEAADGLVFLGPRTFTFGELAEEAADRSPPRRPELRQGSRSRLFGQPLQRLDGPAKANGRMRFAGDVRLPDMLFASARLAPPGGRLTSISREALTGIPGVRHVTVRKRWAAVVAETWWTAERAIKGADPGFSGQSSAPDIRLPFETALDSGRADDWFGLGDYDSVTSGSRALAATYFVAPSLHLGLEPVTATARFSGGALEVWAATQAPDFARAAAARAADLSEADISFYPMPIGDSGGRAMEADAIPMAVELARQLKRPVQLSLSQSASQNHDHPSGGAIAKMMALPGAGGITAAWKMRVASAGGFGVALASLAGREAPTELAKPDLNGAEPPYSIPNVAIDAVPVNVPFEAGYMRGSPQREMCFFTESFVDELAHAVGMEPLAFRMSMLGGNGRLARCFQGAARFAQWDGGGPGSTMGIAGCSAYGSHIGLVATASIGENQKVKAHRLVAVVDCGRVVNPKLVEQQIESGLNWALAQATVPQSGWIAGMPRARPYRDMGLPRIGDAPDILVHLLPSSEPPGGVSGLGAAVLAPALANAIFAGSGKRLRNLPFDAMSAA
jgi:isoquinoline 1-oxidoreductase beta subunit